MKIANDSSNFQFPISNFQFSTLFLIIFSCTLALHGVGCNREQNAVTQPTPETPQQMLQHFSTNHAEAGVTKWVLTGETAEFSKKLTHVKNPTVYIYEKGEIAITVTGDRGELNTSTNNIKVFDNVIGKSQDGTLYTDELHWQNREGKLYAPNESKIIRGSSTITGQEMESNPTLEVVTMKNVQAQIHPKDEKIDATNR